ncbi:hypothetical protein ACJX0J_032727, partial [Zea mays]
KLSVVKNCLYLFQPLMGYGIGDIGLSGSVFQMHVYKLSVLGELDFVEVKTNTANKVPKARFGRLSDLPPLSSGGWSKFWEEQQIFCHMRTGNSYKQPGFVQSSVQSEMICQKVYFSIVLLLHKKSNFILKVKMGGTMKKKKKS